MAHVIEVLVLGCRFYPKTIICWILTPRLSFERCRGLPKKKENIFPCLIEGALKIVKIIKMYQWAWLLETRPNESVFYRDRSFIAKLLLLLQCFLIIALLPFTSLGVLPNPLIGKINTEEPASRQSYRLICYQVIPYGTSEIYLLNMMERSARKDINLHLKN